MTTIDAAGVVEAPVDAVFDHLADLRTHWELAQGRVRLLEATACGAAQGGCVRMRGPLGLSRDATTRVVRAERPLLLEGRARIGSGTVAEIRWQLEPLDQERTRVELTARVVAARAWDRALLAVGGKRWLAALFERVLSRLAAIGPDLPSRHAAAGGLSPAGWSAVARL